MEMLPMHAVVPRLESTPGAIRSPAPRLGEHNRLLLAEIGVGEREYAELLTSGVVVEGFDTAPAS
jgi:crotonobetainyl-CoA:carnitine CoA-transferase CaiB-like acyl-CoA transferase